MMENQADLLPLFKPLCSRKGQKIMIETVREGMAVGLEAAKISRNYKPFPKAATTNNSPRSSPERSTRNRKRSKVNYLFQSVSRWERDHVLSTHDKKPAVGQYSPNHSAVEKTPFRPFVVAGFARMTSQFFGSASSMELTKRSMCNSSLHLCMAG